MYEPYHANDEFADLTDDEVNDAARHGINMWLLSREQNHQNRRGYGAMPHMLADPNKAKRIQALGALAEAAACRCMGWPIRLRAEIFGEPDLPGLIEVKLIGCEWYGLRIYPDTKNDRRVMGVVIPRGKERGFPYRCPGWFLAGDAKQHDEWQISPYGGPALWAVPQRFLRPLSELRELLNGR